MLTSTQLCAIILIIRIELPTSWGQKQYLGGRVVAGIPRRGYKFIQSIRSLFCIEAAELGRPSEFRDRLLVASYGILGFSFDFKNRRMM